MFVFIPIVGIIYCTRQGYLNSVLFLASLFIYRIIYRFIIDYFRLKSKGILKTNDWRKEYLIGFINNKYFVQLFTNF